MAIVIHIKTTYFRRITQHHQSESKMTIYKRLKP